MQIILLNKLLNPGVFVQQYSNGKENCFIVSDLQTQERKRKIQRAHFTALAHFMCLN